MKRKDFISTAGKGLAGMLLLPYILESCKRENLFEESSFKGSVGIVGGGIAGLYAALLLRQQGINVEIFEASGKIGGRIQRLDSFSDFNIDLGPEIVLGQNSVWYDLLRNSGSQLESMDENDFFALDSALLSSSAFEALPEFNALQSLLNELPAYAASDISAQTFAQVSSLPSSMMLAWNSIVANARGTDASQLGMTGLAFASSNQQSGTTRFISSNFDSYHAIQQTFGSLSSITRFHTPISAITYSGSKVTLQDSEGLLYEKDRVIVAVPLAILKNQFIEFTPNLPPLHLQAINAMGMDEGLRIVLKFSTRFWPDQLQSITGGNLVPYYFAAGANGRSSTNKVLSCSVNGVYAETLLALGTDMVPAIVQELDTLFGSTVATDSFEDAHIHNWGEEEFIRGVSSFHPPLFSPELRGQLGSSVANRLFFAGEHTHSEGHHGTVHGAMETAIRAVKQILVSA